MSKTAGLVLILSGLAVAGYGLSEPLDRSQQTDLAKPPATERAADRAVAVSDSRWSPVGRHDLHHPGRRGRAASFDPGRERRNNGHADRRLEHIAPARLRPGCLGSDLTNKTRLRRRRATLSPESVISM